MHDRKKNLSSLILKCSFHFGARVEAEGALELADFSQLRPLLELRRLAAVAGRNVHVQPRRQR